jgi:hypothetical protein
VSILYTYNIRLNVINNFNYSKSINRLTISILYIFLEVPCLHCPQTTKKNPADYGGFDAVIGECLISCGLESCYWWEVRHARGLQHHTQFGNIKQLRVACSERNFTVYCGCSDNILHWLTGDLKMSSKSKHMNAYCLLSVHLLLTYALRMASSNSSHVEKFCAGADIEFLSRIFSSSVHCAHTYICPIHAAHTVHRSRVDPCAV